MSRVQRKTMTWLAALCLLFSLFLPTALAKPQADTSTQQTTATTTTKTTKKKATSAGSASASEIAAAKAKGGSVGQSRYRHLPQGRPLVWQDKKWQVHDPARGQGGWLQRI